MTKRKWLEDSEQQAWLGWMATSQLLDSALDQQLRRDSGLGHAAYAILAALSGAPDRTLRMAVMAMVTHSSQSRTSHAIERMERSGWVVRTRNPTNNREVLATLTGAGQAVLRAAAPGHVRSVRELVFDRLSQEQVAQWTEINQVILQALADSGFTVPDHVLGPEG
jgi:DNA-binding MarR family transcriptional regulator